MGNVQSSQRLLHRASLHFPKALNYGIDLLPIYYYYLNCKLINGIVYGATYRLYRIYHPRVCVVCAPPSTSHHLRQTPPPPSTCDHTIVSLFPALFTNFSNCIPWQTFETICTHYQTHRIVRRQRQQRQRLKVNLECECWCNANEIASEGLLCECIRINAIIRQNNKTK